jgi:hypothetical protein
MLVKMSTTGIFFGGCAWASVYYVGVIDTLRTTETPVVRAGGSSAGALFALGLMLGKSTDELLLAYRELAVFGRTHGCFGKMSIYHDIVLRRWLPEGGSQFRSLNGRLFIGVTQFPLRACLLSNWTSNESLLDDIHASMHIPVYCGFETRRCALDGSFLRSFWDLPEVDSTLYISPFEQEAHVVPRPSHLTISDLLWPPVTEDPLIQLGRQTMTSYLLDQPSLSTRGPFSARRLFRKVCRVGLVLSAWFVFFLRRFLFLCVRQIRLL